MLFFFLSFLLAFVFVCIAIAAFFRVVEFLLRKANQRREWIDGSGR
jgi:uncharacterized membrane protein